MSGTGTTTVTLLVCAYIVEIGIASAYHVAIRRKFSRRLYDIYWSIERASGPQRLEAFTIVTDIDVRRDVIETTESPRLKAIGGPSIGTTGDCAEERVSIV